MRQAKLRNRKFLLIIGMLSVNVISAQSVSADSLFSGNTVTLSQEQEVAANGISLGASQALLLKKIEELTLYMIGMQQENETLKERVRKMEER